MVPHHHTRDVTRVTRCEMKGQDAESLAVVLSQWPELTHLDLRGNENFGSEGYTSSFVIMTKLFKVLWKVKMSVLMTTDKTNFYKGKGKGKGLVVRYPLWTFLNLSSCDSVRFLTSSCYARPSDRCLYWMIIVMKKNTRALINSLPW